MLETKFYVGTGSRARAPLALAERLTREFGIACTIYEHFGAWNDNGIESERGLTIVTTCTLRINYVREIARFLAAHYGQKAVLVSQTTITEEMVFVPQEHPSPDPQEPKPQCGSEE